MNLLYALDLLGTVAFAASGAWAGVRRDMDLFGVVLLGLVTAIGGGTVRDILLGAPPFILKNETYLYLSLIVSLLVFIFHQKMEFIQHPLQYFDAVGLGTFVVIGTGKAIDYHIGFFGSVMMGVMTAVAGGIIRDVLSNQIPMVLQREVYASACIAGGVFLYILHFTIFPRNWTLIVAALIVIIVRLLAIQKGWSLPRVNGRYKQA